MELKEIYAFLSRHRKKLLGITLLFILISCVLYFLLPPKYVASGSLFVGRKLSPQLGSNFTYEGYYGQQAAIMYTNSVIGLMESQDVGVLTLKQLNQEVNETNLKKLARKIITKKTGPQFFTLEIKDSTAQNAQNIWEAVSKNTLELADKINADSDPFINITLVSEIPLVRPTYKNLAVYVLFAATIGFVVSTFYLALKEYLR